MEGENTAVTAMGATKRSSRYSSDGIRQTEAASSTRGGEALVMRAAALCRMAIPSAAIPSWSATSTWSRISMALAAALLPVRNPPRAIQVACQIAEGLHTPLSRLLGEQEEEVLVIRKGERLIYRD